MAEPEEVIATTKVPEEEEDNTISAETTTDTGHMIKKEITNLEEDIKQNEELLSWLNKMDKDDNKNKRKKRDLGGGFGGGPPIYNRRMPGSSQMGPYLPPVVQQSPVLPRQRQGIRYPTYDNYDYDIGPPYGGQLGPAQIAPPKDLPENVEEALGTINDYLANPNQQNVSETTTKKPKRITPRTSTTTKTTTTPIPTKSTTGRVITSTRRLATTIKIPNVTIQPKRKKPTSSIDDAKENVDGNNNVTIKSCMLLST